MIKSEFKLKLVDKPWGFEFELYDNKLVSIWCVSIGQEHKSGYLLDSSSTSFHMHTAKTAKVVVLDGAVKLSKSDESKILNKSKPYVLPPRTPHKLNAYHGNCILIEIESPSNRSDIIRLSDSYGRSKNKYSWDILDSKKIESWKSELRYKETPYDINITGDAKSPCMILSNGVTVKYIKTSINELLKLSDEDTFIVTEGSMLNSLEESVSIVGDIFDKNYRELFLKNTKLGSHFKDDLSGLLISNDKFED
tara:strand:+ start:598 stop:1350 length:753 start_codon:yes stop_codon:yes gene_type:complete